MTDEKNDSPGQETRRRRRSHGGLTLRDVAKLAGVAPITASRALNTPEQVSPEILARVRDAVERTGYVPNILAGGWPRARPAWWRRSFPPFPARFSWR